MPPKKYVIALPNGHFSATAKQVQELHAQLEDLLAYINRVDKMAEQAIRPPDRTSDGMMTREHMYAFFAQKYDNPGMLRNHAGKLFAWIIRRGQDKDNPLKDLAVCGCGKNVEDDAVHLRYHNGRMYFVKVMSLKKYTNALIASAKANTSNGIVNDLRFLLDHL